MSVQPVSGAAFARIAKSDSIYDGWGANQGFLAAKEGTLVVDTGFTLPSARALLKEVRRRSSSAETLVVNTHDHSDHIFGNSVFDESSAITIAHANCRSRFVELGHERIRGYRRFDKRLNSALKGLKMSAPRVTYLERMDFALGEIPLRLIHPKDGAHTSGDTMVLVPDEKVLFAGDVVWVGYHPNLEDANVEGWARALEDIARMNIDFIVPGHGPVADRGCIAPLAKYLRQFDETLRKLVRDLVPKKEIASHLRIPGAEEWQLGMIVERNVEILYEKYLKGASAPR